MKEKKTDKKYFVVIIGLMVLLFIASMIQGMIYQNNADDYCRLVESQRRLINKQFDLVETIKWVDDHNLSFTRLNIELTCPGRMWGTSKVKIINKSSPLVTIEENRN